MGILKKLNGIGRKMKWYDFSLLKLTVLFATLFLVTAWPGFRQLVFGIDWYWYLVITIVLMIPLLRKIFS